MRQECIYLFPNLHAKTNETTYRTNCHTIGGNTQASSV